MLDGISLFKEYKIPYVESGYHQCHQGWVQIHCPFCGDGTHDWYLGFCLEKGNFNCWHCGGLSVWKVLVKILGSEQIAKKAMATYYSDTKQKPVPVVARPKTLWTPPGLESIKKVHKQYLKKRGFDHHALAKWEIQGTTYQSGDWNWRIVFPIHDINGKPVSWCGRTVDPDTKPKYKMSDNRHILVNPKEMIYGIHLAKDFVVIVEGATDVWRLGVGAVAVLGIDWKMEQVSILRQFPRRYIMFDPEPQAQKQAQKLAENLSIYPGETELITGLDSDPGDMDQKQADAFMKSLK